jgi:para-aminobenzoate synthetase component 1
MPHASGFEFPVTVYAIDYEVGGIIEPAAARAGPPRPAGIVRVAVDDALVFDRRTGRTWEIGDLRASELTPGATAEAGRAPAAMRLGPLVSRMGRAGYEAAVQRGLEYIRAGDVYQVNLAHHLSARFEGSPRALLHAILDQASPRYGAYIETPGRTIISASPESFIEFDAATRRVVTRPMKGTRPASGASDLATSQKDRAELAMIVDLMRNDLGRVCEPGSIRVDAARRIEAHAGGSVLQAVAEISGTLRAGRTLADVILATFPGGSVTGAPKIRAMQIIEELEPEPRGIYCGSIGYIDAAGNASLNIAIRTATIENDVVTYPVGAGIVADSLPAQEWEETMLKAGILRNLTPARVE